MAGPSVACGRLFDGGPCRASGTRLAVGLFGETHDLERHQPGVRHQMVSKGKSPCRIPGIPTHFLRGLPCSV